MKNEKTAKNEPLVMPNPFYNGDEVKEYNVMLEIDKYAYGGSIYMGLWAEIEEFGNLFYEPYCDITVNITGYPLNKDCAFLDTNNSPFIVDFLLKNGLGKLTGRTVGSGYCTYPEFQFDIEKCRKHSCNFY